jgi:hypothetical protein
MVNVLWQSHFESECLSVVLMGGTLTCAGCVLRVLRLGVAGFEVVNTLLGPERTDVLSRQKIRSARISVHTAEAFRSFWLVRVQGSGGCVV